MGPRRFLIAELGRDNCKIVLLERSGKKISWNIAENLKLEGKNDITGGERMSEALRQLKHDAQYISVVFGGGGFLVRLLNLPGTPPAEERKLISQVRQTLGIDDSFALQTHIQSSMAAAQEKDLKTASAKTNQQGYSVVVAAGKNELIEDIQGVVREAGLVPVSMLPSGIAGANLAADEMRDGAENSAAGFFLIESHSSILLLFHHTELVLTRQFKTGYRAFVDAVMSNLGLDEETATDILNSGSFDLSDNIASVANNWLHQIGISLDFLERRFGYRVDCLYFLSTEGGQKAIETMLCKTINDTVAPWNQFKALKALDMEGEKQNILSTYALPLGEGMRIYKNTGNHDV